MSFTATVSDEFKLMFNSSRINRLRYFAFAGFGSLTLLILSFLVGFAAYFLSFNPFIVLAIPYLGYLFLNQWWLVKRINDIGNSSKLYFKLLAGFLVLGVFSWAPTLLSQHDPLIQVSPLLKMISILFGIAWFMVGIVYIVYGLYACFCRGTDGDNAYGAEPKPNNFVVKTFFVLFIITFIFNIFASLHRNDITAATQQGVVAGIVDASANPSK